MRILVLKRDKLGDMLLTTPMLSVLRAAYPAAQIDVLANTYNAWVLDGNADVNTVWRYQKTREAGRVHFGAVAAQLWQIAQLRRMRYDWVIVGNGDVSPRAIARARCMGGKRLVSYVAEAPRSSRNAVLLPLPQDMHEVARLAHLLSPLGIEIPAELPAPCFHLPAESASFATQWLAERRLAPGGYITLGLGARRAKRQPSAEQVLRWARHFHECWGLHTVFMWTPGKSDNPLYPGDDDTAQQVLDAGLACLHPFRGAIRPALGLIWAGKTSLFPDSGLMHFAAASPGGVLGFFADIEASPPPAQWAPLGPRARWLAAAKRVADLDDELVLSNLQGLITQGAAA